MNLRKRKEEVFNNFKFIMYEEKRNLLLIESNSSRSSQSSAAV